jgi:hypothetical protein
MENIYITWEGPFTLKDLKNNKYLKDEDEAYGLYQIYGTHPIYGSNVLLYIGKTNSQTFAKRIKQEGWEYNSDSNNIKIYVGKLFDKKQPKEAIWDKLISHAERLLIFTHAPAHNSSNINTLSRSDEILKEIKNIRVINYDNYRDLMSEVSGDIYIESLDWFDDTKIFTAKNL